MQFNYWNNLNDEYAPEKCKFNEKESLKYCRLNSGGKVTLNLALQLTGIFVLNLLLNNLKL